MNDPKSTDGLIKKRKDIEEENEFLVLQLHRLQEGFEAYSLRSEDPVSSEPISINISGSGSSWVDNDLPVALAEVERLRTLVLFQAKIKDIEIQNSLNIRLGNMLIDASNSVWRITKLPFSLLSFWKREFKKVPPKLIGGKEFTAVINIYNDKGFEGVQNLLKSDRISSVIKGNALTALARHLMQRDAKAAELAASKAFEIDPKPYRLKWLAFRSHEAGDALKAEAMLDLLPNDMTFSDSEKNQVNQIRFESSTRRQIDARRKTKIVSKQQYVQKEIADLKERAESFGKDNAILSQQNSTLQKELGTLRAALEDHAKLAGDRLTQINALTDERNGLVTFREEAVKLSQQNSTLQKELGTLRAALEDHAKLAGDRLTQINALTDERNGLVTFREEAVKLSQQNSTLQKELGTLRAALEDHAKLAGDRLTQINALTDERNGLVTFREEAVKLSQQNSTLQKELGTLRAALEDHAKLAGDRLTQINALTDERNGLVIFREEAVKQTKELINQVKTLNKEKLEILKYKEKIDSKEAYFQQQQQYFSEEMVRAEAQLEIIKEILLGSTT